MTEPSWPPPERPSDSTTPWDGSEPQLSGDHASWGPPQPEPPASPQPAPGYAQATPAAPQYGQPQDGQPQYGQPQYGQPQYGQPQYGQPQYGQPQYGQPQYGKSQYGQPEYGQTQYGQPAPGSGYQVLMPPGGRRRSRRLVIGLIVGGLVVVAVIAAVAYAVVHPKGRDQQFSLATHSITVPTSAAGYTQLTSPDAQDLGSRALTGLQATGSKAWEHAKFGVYGKGAGVTPKMFFLAVSAKDNSRLKSELRRQSTVDFSKGVMQGAGITDDAEYPAGPLGGVLRCGHLPVAAGVMATCTWVDGSTIGVIYLPNGTLTDAATVSLAVRSAAEH
jgi:hypothetical protein